MTPLGFMRMTNLAQGAINSIALFLASCLEDQIKLFLNNVRVKRPKIIYNNEKLAFGIK